MVGGVAAGHEIKSPVGEGEVFGVAQEEGGVAVPCSSASLRPSSSIASVRSTAITEATCPEQTPAPCAPRQRRRRAFCARLPDCRCREHGLQVRVRPRARCWWRRRQPRVELPALDSERSSPSLWLPGLTLTPRNPTLWPHLPYVQDQLPLFTITIRYDGMEGITWNQGERCMELRQVRYFAAVARHRHFTRAAAELGLAQPALSQQVRALERELAVVLIDRGGRRVQLMMPAGVSGLGGAHPGRCGGGGSGDGRVRRSGPGPRDRGLHPGRRWGASICQACWRRSTPAIPGWRLRCGRKPPPS